MFKSICLFAGNANPGLAQGIAGHLEVPLGRAKVGRFGAPCIVTVPSPIRPCPYCS